MGKTRTAVVSEEPVSNKAAGRKKKKRKKSAREEKGVRIPGLKGGERIVAVEAEPVPTEVKKETKAAGPEGPLAEREKKPKVRGKKYKSARAKIDKSKLYSLTRAVKLAKETSYAAFNGTVELHLVVKSTGLSTNVTLPHPIGKGKKTKILAKQAVKTEKKVPLIHSVVGKVDQKDAELVENAKAIISAVGKRQIQRAYLTSTMGPSVRVEVD